MHNLIQVDELREPMEVSKAYEKDHLENIWLNYEIQYWHWQDNLTKGINFFVTEKIIL